MKRMYFCLECRAMLNPNVKIMLTMAQGRHRSLILLSPRPGDSSVILPGDVVLRRGDVVEFFCPICGANLRSKANEHLAEIGFRLEDGGKGRVNFSRKYGEHATYFVTKEQVRSYGENAAIYGDANFFGAGRKREELLLACASRLKIRFGRCRPERSFSSFSRVALSTQPPGEMSCPPELLPAALDFGEGAPYVRDGGTA